MIKTNHSKLCNRMSSEILLLSRINCQQQRKGFLLSIYQAYFLELPNDMWDPKLHKMKHLCIAVKG